MSRPVFRILLDECIDWRFSRHLQPHTVTSVAKAGWAGIKNGELLRRAELDFDLFVTVDRNLSFQQEIIGFDLAVIVLAAPSNRLRDLVPLAPRILDVIPSCEPGRVHLVS